MTILLVDEAQAERDALHSSLRFDGYTVLVAEDPDEVVSIVEKDRPDVVLIAATSSVDGVELCRELRATGSIIPLFILSRSATVADRVRGLDAGADDCLSYPYAMEELLARLRALLRRARAGSVEQRSELICGDLVLSYERHEISRSGHAVALTRTEFALMELFMTYPQRVLSKSFILERVWGEELPTSGNTLEVYIGYLRRKTETAEHPRVIQTVRGVGYILREGSSGRGEDSDGE